MMKFDDICAAFAARDLFYCGVPVEEIARQANKPVATVKKMIKMACGVVSWESAEWLRDKPKRVKIADGCYGVAIRWYKLDGVEVADVKGDAGTMLYGIIPMESE